MVKIVAGIKGTGKTKALIGMVNRATQETDGNVVCIEKSQKLTYDIDHRARLIDTDNYAISGYDAFYGFIAGLLAGNYDITEMFVDTTLQIGGRNFAALADMIDKLIALTKSSGFVITLTVSADKSELPERMHEHLVDF